MNPVEVKDLPGLVGTEVGVSDWVLVDQDRVNKFADATGDHQWIHVDVERATREIGGPIAHGYLTLSLIPALIGQIFLVENLTFGVNYGCNKVRFAAPVPAGSRIRLGVTVASVEEIADGVQVVLDSILEVEDAEKPSCVAQVVYRYYR